MEKFKSKQPGLKHNNAAWAGMIYDLDKSIGTLLEEIDRLGISNNTYIILMADNGAVELIPPVSNKLQHPSQHSTPTRNFPLRGGKWTLYEGGIRVPFMVRGPGIEAGQSDVPVIGWDILPTLCELASKKPTKIEGIDGGSLVQVLRGKEKQTVSRPSEYFYFHRFAKNYPHSAIMKGNMKLIKFWKLGNTELFDLSKDLGELQDISKQQPALVKELEEKLETYIAKNNPTLTKNYSKND